MIAMLIIIFVTLAALVFVGGVVVVSAWTLVVTVKGCNVRFSQHRT